MNWSGMQTVLAAQVTTIAGCQAYWRDVTAQWEAWPRVFLSVVSSRKLGQDETRTRYVDADDVILPRVYGGRVVTVQIQVESRDQNLAASASAIGEQVRTRLGRPGVLAALRAVDIGVSTTSDVRVVNRVDDKARVVSYAVFEAVLLTHVSDEEDDSADLGYIETAEIVQTIAPTQTDVTKTYLVGPQDTPTPDEEYMASGTYTPTITSDGSATVALALSAGYSRVGNGAGVPSAGDTVTVWGLIEASGLVDGEVITIPLPFEVAAPSISYAARPIGNPDSDLVTLAAIYTPTALSIRASVNVDTSGDFYFHAIYQTANAVDP